MSNDTGNNSRNSHQLACLYTKHKTQKRKVWQDGRLVLKSTKAILHDADPPPGSGDPSLGECEITFAQFQAILQQSGTMLETERYLIEVEGPWTSTTATSSSSSSLLQRNKPKKNGLGMKKVLTTKFQKPKAYIPPPPGTSTSNNVLKRKRPLQPGELVARHHGGMNRDGYNRNPNPNNPYPEHSVQQQQQHISFSPFQDRRTGGEPNQSRNPYRPQTPAQQYHHHQQQHHQPQTTLAETTSYRTPEGPNSRSTGFNRNGAGGRGRPMGRHGQNNVFASNDYESSRYYGDDEEEEESGTPELPAPTEIAPASSIHSNRGNNNNRNGYCEQRDIERNQKHSANSDQTTITSTNQPNDRGEEYPAKYNENIKNLHPQQLEQQQQHAIDAVSSSSISHLGDGHNSNYNAYGDGNNTTDDKGFHENSDCPPSNDSSQTNQLETDRGPVVNHQISSDSGDPEAKGSRQRQRYHNEEEESESDSDVDDDCGNGMPSSFRLKSIASSTATNQNNRDSGASSGNRLLALFGAGNFRNVVNENFNSKNDKIEGDIQSIGPGKENSGGGGNGFCLPPAASSSEESSSDEDEE